MSDRTRPNVAALHTEANGIRVRLDALAVDFADGALTSSQLRAATARLRARLTDVEALVADAGRVDVLGPLIGADDVCAAWDALPTSRKRVIVSTLAKVTLFPPGRGVRTFRSETVGIEWLEGL